MVISETTSSGNRASCNNRRAIGKARGSVTRTKAAHICKLDQLPSPAPTTTPGAPVSGHNSTAGSQLDQVGGPTTTGGTQIGAAAPAGSAPGGFGAGGMPAIDPVVMANVPGVGEPVLGHFPEYKQLGDSLGARTFNIPEAVWSRMSESERWGANQRFLDRIISRGDDIILATPLDKVRPGSYFARELEYLGGKGYVPSADGSKLIKP